tara:strand:- start:5636 stop:5857 length:222 start_codon:yes stop_codon:yes gene_type:complete
MIKKVNFTMDLRDVITKNKRSSNIVEPMDVMNDELLDKLVDEMITNHVRDFIRNYVKKEMGYGSLEFNGDLLF